MFGGATKIRILLRFGRWTRRSCAQVLRQASPPGMTTLEKGLSRMVSRRASRSLQAAAFAAMILAGTRTLAHSWYPAWCCNDQDCHELLAARGETVLETEDGYRLWDGRFVGREYTKASPDAKFHICEEHTTKAIICFFVPQGQS